jgi:hypothetical protein
MTDSKSILIFDFSVYRNIGPTCLEFSKFSRSEWQNRRVTHQSTFTDVTENRNRYWLVFQQQPCCNSVVIPSAIKFGTATVLHDFDYCFSKYLSSDAVARVGEYNFTFKRFIFSDILYHRLREFDVYPSSLSTSRLALNSLNLVLSGTRLLLRNIQLSPGVHPVHKCARISTLGLTAHNFGLLGHFLNLNSNETRSSHSSPKSEYCDSISSSRKIKTLEFKRFQFIVANQLHEYWLAWFRIASGFCAVYWGWWLLWRGCGWLTGGVSSLGFLLTYSGTVGISYVIHSALNGGVTRIVICRSRKFLHAGTSRSSVAPW